MLLGALLELKHPQVLPDVILRIDVRGETAYRSHRGSSRGNRHLVLILPTLLRSGVHSSRGLVDRKAVV
jgi:hypothetical protein